MNTRKIKLALTVALMNLDPQGNAIQLVRDLVSDLKDAGAFLGLRRVKASNLGPSQLSETYALQFEHCTVALNMVSDLHTRKRQVQGFHLV